MLRNFSCAAAGLIAFLPATALSLRAADKSPTQSSALVTARQDVAAALKAEAAGNNERRSDLLAKAWLAAPDLPEANWHMARVKDGERWALLAEITNERGDDPNRARYGELRDKAAGNPKALRDLARWCQRQGWTDRARLHYAQLLAIPAADGAMKAEAVKELDLRQVDGRWMTGKEVAERNSAAKELQSALAKWAPQIKKLQVVIDGDDFKRRDKAIEEIHH